LDHDAPLYERERHSSHLWLCRSEGGRMSQEPQTDGLNHFQRRTERWGPRQRALYMRLAWKLIILTSILIHSASGQGKLLVVPQESAGVAGESNYLTSRNSPFQQIFSASEFSSLNGEFIQITAISFRANEGPISTFQATIPSVDLWFSTNPRPINEMRPGFPEDNYGPDRINVYSGKNVQLSARPSLTGGAPPFDFRFDFQNPYNYRVGGGNLVIDVKFEATGATPNFDGEWMDGADRARFVFFGPGALGSSDWQIESLALITQFEYSVVPEPRSLMIAILAATLCLVQWKRK
jgi:hypothetical protein